MPMRTANIRKLVNGLPPSVLPGASQTQALYEHIAYHEAGHALAAVALGEVIEWVAIAPAQGLVNGGRCVSRGSIPDKEAGRIAHLALYLAGTLAETFSPHQQTLRAAGLDRRNDLEALQEEIMTVFPGADATARHQIVQAAYRAACALLARPGYGPAVQSIAAALIQHGTLDHQEVQALLVQAQATAEAARHGHWAWAWRWFWISSGLLFVADLVASATLAAVVKGWLLLVGTVGASALLPFLAWKLALRRSAQAQPVFDATPLNDAWLGEEADRGQAGQTSPASTPGRETPQRRRLAAPKHRRGRYARHRRLPQRRALVQEGDK